MGLSDENRPITPKQVAMLGGAGTMLVALVMWAAGVAGHVTEHDRVLAEHAAAIVALQKEQQLMMEQVTSKLSTLVTDQAVAKEKLSTVSETLARLDGRLTPSVIQQPPQVQVLPAKGRGR